MAPALLCGAIPITDLMQRCNDIGPIAFESRLPGACAGAAALNWLQANRLDSEPIARTMSCAISSRVGGNWQYRTTRPTSAPRFVLGRHTILRLIDYDDSDALLAMVEESRAHLTEWLPGLENRICDDLSTRQFIMIVKREERRGRALHFGIWHHGRLAGVVTLEQIDLQRKRGAVGYWLHHGFQGKGLVSASVVALCRHGIQTLGLARIELATAVGNVRSRRVAERLGFQFEGILRCRGQMRGEPVDHAVYSLTVRDALPDPVCLDESTGDALPIQEPG